MGTRSELEEQLRLGVISYSEWSGYAWKNELHDQSACVLQHLKESIDELDCEHNVHHMMERAFGITAFCMRRLIECRLVTDRFRETPLPIYRIPRRTESMPKARDPFLRMSGGGLFETFDLTSRERCDVLPKVIADHFLHARVLAVLSRSAYLSDGLLIASDRQMTQSLYHVTSGEYEFLVSRFLNDVVQFEQDWIDRESGKILAKRE